MNLLDRLVALLNPAPRSALDEALDHALALADALADGGPECHPSESWEIVELTNAARQIAVRLSVMVDARESSA